MNTTTVKIDNTQDIIDSRDVIERIEQIDDELETLCEDFDDEDAGPGTRDEIQEQIDELREELAPLKALADEASGYAGDW